MGKKLYVGNLSYQVDSSELEQLFGQHGQVVSAQIINDRDTGRSKGFGFVEMGTDEEAQAAIAALNGQEHGGRALTVNEARPREDRPRGGGGGGGDTVAAAVEAAADEVASAAAEAAVAVAATEADAIGTDSERATVRASKSPRAKRGGFYFPEGP